MSSSIGYAYYNLLTKLGDDSTKNSVDSLINTIITETFIEATIRNDMKIVKKILDLHDIKITPELFNQCLQHINCNNTIFIEWLYNLDIKYFTSDVNKQKIMINYKYHSYTPVLLDFLLKLCITKTDRLFILSCGFYCTDHKWIFNNIDFKNDNIEMFIDMILTKMENTTHFKSDYSVILIFNNFIATVIQTADIKLSKELIFRLIDCTTDIATIRMLFQNYKYDYFELIKKIIQTFNVQDNQLPLKKFGILLSLELNLTHDQWFEIFETCIIECFDSIQHYNTVVDTLLSYHEYPNEILEFGINILMDKNLENSSWLLILQQLDYTTEQKCKLIVNHFKNKPKDCLRLTRSELNNIKQYISSSLTNQIDENLRKELLKKHVRSKN